MLDKVLYIKQKLQTDIVMLRCLLGVSLALIISSSLNLPSPQLSAVIAITFLGKKQPKVTLKKSIIIFLALVLFGYIGQIVARYLIDFPLVFLPVLGLIVFWSLRLINIPNPVRMLFLMFTVLLGFITLQAKVLGEFTLVLLLFQVLIALSSIQIAYFVFPFSNKEIIKKEQAVFDTKKINLNKLAFNGLLVLLPLLAAYFTFNLNLFPLTLIFVVILGFDPFVHESKTGQAFIVANIIGGLVGVLAYQILVITPSFLLYILLIVAIGGYFVVQIFSDKKTAPIYELAYKTFFVVMGTISVTTNSAGAAVGERLLQIGIAVLYVVLAYKVVNVFNNPRILNESN